MSDGSVMTSVPLSVESNPSDAAGWWSLARRRVQAQGPAPQDGSRRRPLELRDASVSAVAKR
jgi:hypothetical protein